MSGIENAIVALGLEDFTLPALRPTTASRFSLSGMSIYEIASTPCNTNISTAIKYSRLANDQVIQKQNRHRTIFRSLGHLEQSWARLSDPQSMWLSESDKLPIENTLIAAKEPVASCMSSNQRAINRPTHSMMFRNEN
jgi:hypothetical protein